MNLSQLRTAVRTRCGFNGSDSFHTDDSLNAAINEANWTLADEQDWPWLTDTETLSTVAGTATVAVASDWKSTVSLHRILDTFADRLDPVSIDDIDRYSDNQGCPQVFAEWGSALVLAPVPDNTYSLRHRYRRVEDELIADTDTPLSPQSMHRLIVLKAAAIAFARDGNIVESRSVLVDYESAVVRARRRLNRSGSPSMPRVRPGAGWG